MIPSRSTTRKLVALCALSLIQSLAVSNAFSAVSAINCFRASTISPGVYISTMNIIILVTTDFFVEPLTINRTDLSVRSPTHCRRSMRRTIYRPKLFAEHLLSGTGRPRVPTMSAAGQSRRFEHLPATSGLPQRTDVVTGGQHVSKVPIPEVADSLDHLVGAAEHSRRDCETN